MSRQNAVLLSFELKREDGSIYTYFRSSYNHLCEVISLECALLLMDTDNVIAHRMYPSPVRYTLHYFWNVNNTPSSDS